MDYKRTVGLQDTSRKIERQHDEEQELSLEGAKLSLKSLKSIYSIASL